jgi:prepilin-type N-terminal cleavage/methylation domain-containing protein
MMTRRGRTRFRGFTLLELMIGVGIVAIMAAIALPAYSKYMTDIRRSEAIGMLQQSLRAQQEVPIQWASRGEHAVQSNLVSEENGDRDFCRNMQFTEFFNSPHGGVPTVPLQFPGARYNLIMGRTENGCWADHVQGATQLAELEGYPHLSVSENLFGVNAADGEFLIGAERTLGDGSLDVMFINSRGSIFLMCDEGQANSEAENFYSGVTNMAAHCQRSAQGASLGEE